MHPHGARSKPRLADSSREIGVTNVDLTGLNGIVEYEPSEFVITALAGTPVSEVEAKLAEHGQFLPFDPMFVSGGSTIGGAVASGLSGPGRQRFGGVRDFVIGIKFVDADGRKLSAGGKVVKNAAGFDFPKLFVGSLGRLGVLYEITFKVFPTPDSYLTTSFELGHVESAISAAREISVLPFDAYAIHISPPGNLMVRLGGAPAANETTAERIEAAISSSSTRLRGEAETARWNGARNCDWAQGRALIKIPSTPGILSDLDATLGRLDSKRRYSCAGNVAFASLDLRNVDALADGLDDIGLTGLVLRGDCDALRIGSQPSKAPEARVKRAMDPHDKFLPLP